MSDRAMLVVYDIPEGAEMPNPSAEFRQFAFRINLSCWVMREGDLPLASFTLNRVREVGGNWHTLPVAEDGADTVIGLATGFVQKEIRDHMYRATRSNGRLLARLVEATDVKKACQKFRNRSKQITKNLNKLVQDMRKLCNRWGINSHQAGLLPAMSGIASMQATAYATVAKYVKAAEKLKASNHPLASAARAGQVPLGVIADAMDDAEMVNDDGTPASTGLRSV